MIRAVWNFVACFLLFMEIQLATAQLTEWPASQEVYSVRLKIVSVNRMGLLMEVSTIFGESKTNVSSANIRTSSNNTAEIEVTVEVTDTQHLPL
jgi:(p)ppGpp synthase/HD superfamily hydrolase